MRTISADANAVLLGVPQFRARIQVKDAGGTFRDLTTYAGPNFVKTLTWHGAIDAPGVDWECTFFREMELLSFAPLMQSSGLNRGFNIASAYRALLEVGRQMKIEWAIQSADDPGAPTWNLGFTGYVDTVGWGDSDELKLTGRDDTALLIEKYIEVERIYAFAQGASATRGCFVFHANATLAVNDLVLPSESKVNSHFYKVTSITTGITASSEPIWPTGGGSTVVSGGVTFTEVGATSTSTGTAVETIMQQILDDNLGAGVVTLNVPVSPSWSVKWFKVDRQALFDELRLLADQIGWCLRPKYDSGSGTMKLTLYDPNRSSTTSLRTFTYPQLKKIRKIGVEIFDIRNAIQVVYSDSQNLTPGGVAPRKTISVSDSSSITKYGRRFGEIAEASASNIDTSAEATTLANAVLNDLREPDADIEADLAFFPFVELPDIYTLTANGIHFDTDQKLAVIDFKHTHSAQAFSSTTIRMRGRPASGASMWVQRQTESFNGETNQLTSMENTAPIAITIDTKPVGGVRINFTWNGPRNAKDVRFELHLSTSAGFTPSPSTLYASGKDQSFEVGNLDPAKAYYCQIVPVVWG